MVGDIQKYAKEYIDRTMHPFTALPTPLERHNNIPETTDPEKSYNLSLALHLRDLFTPACEESFQLIQQLTPDQIKEVEQGFTEQVKKEDYLPWDEVNFRHCSIEFKDKDDDYVLELIRSMEEEGPLPQDVLSLYSLTSYLEYKKTRNTDVYGEFNPQEASREYGAHLEILEKNLHPKKLNEVDAVINAQGRFKEYYFSSLESLNPYFDMKRVVLPVGDYGEEFTRRLLLTVKIMARLVEVLLEKKSQEMVKNNKALVYEHTARGNPIETTIEGIVSIAQSSALSLAQKLEQFPDSDKALEVFIKSKVPNSIALHTPMGFVGPLTLGGKYVPGMVGVKEDRLALTGQFYRFVEPLLEAYKKLISDLPPEMRSSNTGYGCPVAMQVPGHYNTGVHALSLAFWHVFESVD